MPIFKGTLTTRPQHSHMSDLCPHAISFPSIWFPLPGLLPCPQSHILLLKAQLSHNCHPAGTMYSSLCNDILSVFSLAPALWISRDTFTSLYLMDICVVFSFLDCKLPEGRLSRFSSYSCCMELNFLFTVLIKLKHFISDLLKTQVSCNWTTHLHATVTKAHCRKWYAWSIVSWAHVSKACPTECSALGDFPLLWFSPICTNPGCCKPGDWTRPKLSKLHLRNPGSRVERAERSS